MQGEHFPNCLNNTLKYKIQLPHTFDAFDDAIFRICYEHEKWEFH